MYYGGKGKKLDFKFGEGSMYYWGKGKEPNFRFGQSLALEKIA
jgi:hypothetical protein